MGNATSACSDRGRDNQAGARLNCRARYERPLYLRDQRDTKKSGLAKVGQDREDPAVIVGSFVEPELEKDLPDMRLDRLGTQDE
jgi:hypothetical protein